LPFIIRLYICQRRNGEKAGEHTGGYTPFNFDITANIVDGDNFVVLKVDNKRYKDAVPTVNIAQVPDTYIEDYSIQLDKNKKDVISGWVQLNSPVAEQTIHIEIPKLKIKRQLITDTQGKAAFEVKAKPELWSPENPKLYEVIISKADETIVDKTGFRTIETKGKQILLNGKPVFLRGISIHEEAPYRSGRADARSHAQCESRKFQNGSHRTDESGNTLSAVSGIYRFRCALGNVVR
jgi:beta-glucuronidase